MAAASTLRQVACDPKAIWSLAKDAVSAWVDDFAPSMGAAISYYTVFSIAPLMLIVIAVAGLALGHDAATGKIFAELEGFLGKEGAAAIQGMVKSASGSGKGTFGTIAGIVMLLVGATTVFNELQSALDRIWRTPAAVKSEGIWALLRTRFLSFGLILAIGFLLLVSLVVSAGLSAAGALWEPYFENWTILLQVINFVVSALIITVLFALIYKYLPRAKIGWHDVWIGAAVTALLFTIGKLLIGLYIGKSGVVSGFGAAGSIVLVLLWVYYSAQIFLLGAEFTWLYAYRFGSRKGEEPDADAVCKSAFAERAAVASAKDALPAKGAKQAEPMAPQQDGARPATAPVLPTAPALAPRLRAVARAGGWVAAAVATGAALQVAAKRFGVADRVRYMVRSKRFSLRKLGWRH